MKTTFDKVTFTDLAVTRAMEGYSKELIACYHYNDTNKTPRPSWDKLPDIAKYQRCKIAGNEIYKEQINR